AKTGANKKKDANPEQTFRVSLYTRDKEPVKESVKGRLRRFVADGPLDVLAGVYPAVPQTVDRPEIFETIEYIFLAFYVCEMLTRVVLLRKSWFYTAEEGLMWANYFDATIVIFGLVDVLVQKVALPEEGETHFGAVLLRLLKVFKDTFFASLSSLFWSMIMLVCMLIAALILCVETSTTIGIDRREWLFIRYGSFFRAMYTMFEITFSGGWPNLVRPLVDEVSILFVIPGLSITHWAESLAFTEANGMLESYCGLGLDAEFTDFAVFGPDSRVGGKPSGLRTLIYVVAIVFAALRLITALFVRSTMQVLNDDAAAAILERMQRSAELQDKLLQVFNDADADGDGYLTLKEFERMLELPEIKHYLSVLDMDVRDARMLLVLLLHETGKVRKECQAILQVLGGNTLRMYELLAYTMAYHGGGGYGVQSQRDGEQYFRQKSLHVSM
ncbi:hypothetical protein AK812_SmicGene44300, partial [Symbiodinium microadriaticum]